MNVIVQSQIVNIENKRLSTSKDGFSGNVDLNFNLTYATKQIIQLGDLAKVAYRKEKHYAMILIDHALVMTNTDDEVVNKGFEHLRYNYAIGDSNRVVFEAFHQGQFNKIQKINLRLLVGSGFRFNLINQANYVLSVGTSLVGEYEEMDVEAYDYTSDILSSSYFYFDGQFTENFGLNTIFYAQPKFIDLGQYRLASETQLKFKINKFMSYKVVYTLNHDSRHIEGVRKTNYTFKNTLSFKF